MIIGYVLIRTSVSGMTEYYTKNDTWSWCWKELRIFANKDDYPFSLKENEEFLPASIDN